MKEEKIKEINSILDKAKWLLGIGILVILIMPFLLTFEFFHERFNFSETGQIGDTIGGITAPFLNLIGAFLIFYALKAQVTANELVQRQIDKENDNKECETEAKNLNQLYSYLLDSINSFKFTTLPLEDLRNTENIDTEVEYSGGDAFYHLFSQIRCHYHGTPEELHKTQSVSELMSVLKIMHLILEKLKYTKSNNKEIIETLTKNLFDYKIITRIRDEEIETLRVEFCETCQCNHGLPEELRTLISDIKAKLIELK
ncbi:MAG: hypothetical protein Q8K92_24070 [Leadbetterella sp.]|nr:hypothetical protein [Leadbetterella sp.]